MQPGARASLPANKPPRLALLVLLLPFLAPDARAEWRAVGSVTAVIPLADGMQLQTAEATVRITALSPAVVRVRYQRTGAPWPDDPFAVVADTGLVPPAVRVEEDADAAHFDTGALVVRVQKSPLRLRFLDRSGAAFLEDAPGEPVAWDGPAFRVTEVLPDDTHVFGLGNKAGPLDRRGRAFVQWNTDHFGWQESSDPLYQSVPFFLGLRRGAAFGVFLDDPFRTTFDIGVASPDRLSFGADGGPLDVYVLYGPAPADVLRAYTALTGHVPLPPLKFLGFQQSRYSYFPEARVREIAGLLRRHRIPSDVIHLDIDYQDRNRPFTIDRQRFPHFEGLIADLARDGFAAVAITDLHVAKVPGTRPYDEGLAGDHFVKNPDGSVFTGEVWPGASVFPDFTRRLTREWWGSLYRDFVAMGVGGFWNDMNEPSVFDGPGKTMPSDVVHRFEDRSTTHREAHDVYGMQQSRATFEGLLGLRPDRRPFVLTRATFAGGQRYAATWTGDNSSTWTHLRLSVPTLLGLGLSGFAFVGADVGGYAGSPPPDLLTRWLQAGAFTPFFRNHTCKGTRDQEPWVHGPRHLAIRRAAIEARYRLMPYLYTAMEEASRTGMPAMRAMILQYPDFVDGPGARVLDTQFLLGPDLLVAPALSEGLDPYEVVLPPGTWFDYATGERVEGGRSLYLAPALDRVPVYVRAGAIVPHQPLVQHLGQVPDGPLELRVYPGPDCRGSVYADDGETLQYRQGKFARVAASCQAGADGTVRVRVEAPDGPFRPWWKAIQVSVAGLRGKPHVVRVDGKPARDLRYDAASRTASVIVPAGPAEVVFEGVL